MKEKELFFLWYKKKQKVIFSTSLQLKRILNAHVTLASNVIFERYGCQMHVENNVVCIYLNFKHRALFGHQFNVVLTL